MDLMYKDTIMEDSRRNDPAWFDFAAIPRKFKSKIRYLTHIPERRFLSYWKRGNTWLTKNAPHYKTAWQKILVFHNIDQFDIKNVFNRKNFLDSNSLCVNEKGLIMCQGKWNEAHCQFNHSINPYRR